MRTDYAYSVLEHEKTNALYSEEMPRERIQNKLSPSMMCANIMDMPQTLRLFERYGVEYLHIDIMDGSFVPNFTLGTDYCKALKANSHIPLDIHLMIENPEQKLPWFPMGEGDYVCVHAESTRHLQRVLVQIRDRGAKPMVALNPATPICALENILDDIDAVLIMTVNPGYAGQKLVPAMLEKIYQVRQYLDARGYGHVEIEVDGNVSFENAVRMRDAGANIFVVGSSSVFSSKGTLEENIQTLRKAIK